jgi:pSer/pThr/pTyr-binding forkhead associated (FHA) protein
MRKDQEDQVDPSRPALIVVYGATKRKCRPLLGDVVVVGRSPGCDIGIVSPEVAPVHCVLLRMSDGWRIRDCSGRATRLNGQAIREEPLRNGDVIQVGAFSFEAHLPNVPTPANPASAPVSDAESAAKQIHLERSRRRFASRALRLRARVHEQQRVEGEMVQRQADLEHMEQRLRALHQEAQTKQAKPEPERKPPPPLEPSHLDGRARELAHFAQHLRRREERLREADAARNHLEQERQELAELRHTLQQRRGELESMVMQFEEMVQAERQQIDLEREQIGRERTYLDEQRQELIRQRAEVERLQTETEVPVQPDTPSSRDTWSDEAPDARLESARRLLRELAERRKAHTRPTKEG